MTLEEILIDSLDDEIKIYEDLVYTARNPNFSAKHYATIKDAIRLADTYENGKFSPHMKPRHIKPRHFAVAILIAILVMVSSVMTFAIVHPEYYMIIKEKVKEWSITFETESEDEVMEKFEIRKGDTPDGFSISSETEDEQTYMVDYISSEGRQILYAQQLLSDATVVGLDSENDSKKVEVVNGIQTVVMKKKDCYTLFWVKDNCSYTLVGNCSLEILEQYQKSTL